MKKKITILVLIVTFVFLTACGQKPDESGEAHVKNMFIEIPDGFKTSTNSGLFMAPGYPEDTSNLYIYSEKKYDDFDTLMGGGKEDFAENLKNAYSEQYGEDVDICISAYEKTTVGNYPAYYVELSYNLMGDDYLQKEYIIDGDVTYYIAFSNVGGNDHTAEFEAAMKTIRFE